MFNNKVHGLFIFHSLPEFNGGTYLRHFMYMFYDGHVIGLEPNITLRYLKMKPRSLDGLQVPKFYPETGYYPSFSRVNYDAATKTYTLALDGFKKFTAAKS